MKINNIVSERTFPRCYNNETFSKTDILLVKLSVFPQHLISEALHIDIHTHFVSITSPSIQIKSMHLQLKIIGLFNQAFIDDLYKVQFDKKVLSNIVLEED